MPLVNCLVDDMLLQTGPCSNQAPILISNIEYRRAVDMLLHDTPDPTVHWIQVGTIQCPQVSGNEVRCRVHQKCHRVRTTVSNS